MNVALALACVALLGVIAAQDWLYIPLRNKTISAGLTGPYHWWLDAAYVPLALSLALRYHTSLSMEPFAVIAAVLLLAVAATNTAWRFFDKLDMGGHTHSYWHSMFTLALFVDAFVLQVIGDISHPGLRAITLLSVFVPGAAYGYFHFEPTTIKGVTIQASPAAEKLYVLGLCLWFIIGAL